MKNVIIVRLFLKVQKYKKCCQIIQSIMKIMMLVKIKVGNLFSKIFSYLCNFVII